DADEPVAVLEAALRATVDAEAAEKKLRKFERSGRLDGIPTANVRDLADAAFANGGLSSQEHDLLTHRNMLRDRVIAVDDFPRDLSEPAARADAHRHPA